MTLDHASDWSWVRGECAPCGYRVTAEMRPHEHAALNERRFGIWLTATARELRFAAQAQIVSDFRQKGCPHACASF